MRLVVMAGRVMVRVGVLFGGLRGRMLKRLGAWFSLRESRERGRVGGNCYRSESGRVQSGPRTRALIFAPTGGWY